MTSYHIKTPAKLNIRLKVTGRRPDGYHELVTVMVPIDLFDHLSFQVLSEGGVGLECDGFPLPSDPDNLVHRAACAFLEASGIKEGVAIRLTKNIPIAAGMGGGSSDAAATLLALNEIRSGPLSRAELHRLATALGADVPFFLACTPALATGIGEVLEPLRRWPRAWYVTVTPRLEISTAWVYGQLRLELTPGEYAFIINFLEKDPIEPARILENDLEKVTSARYPIIHVIKGLLMKAGAEGAMMTGSGPTVFGLFSSQDQATAAREALLSRGVGTVCLAGGWERSVSLGSSIFETAT